MINKIVFLIIFILMQNVFAGSLFEIKEIECKQSHNSYFYLNMNTEMITAKIDSIELTNEYSLDPDEVGENIEFYPGNVFDDAEISSLIMDVNGQSGGSLSFIVKKEDVTDIFNGIYKVIYTKFGGESFEDDLDCEFIFQS